MDIGTFVPSFSTIFTLANYRFNPHAIPVFVTTTLMGFFAFRVITYQNTPITRRFTALCIASMVWLGSTAVGYLVASDEVLAAFWFRLDWLGVSFIPISYYAYTLALLEHRETKRLYIGCALSVFFAVTTLIWNPQMHGVKHFSWGFFPQHGVTWSPFFFAYFFGYVMWTFNLYISALRNTSNTIRHRQIRWAFTIFLTTYLGSVDFLPSYGVPVYPWGFAPVLSFVALSTYAIIYVHLMDIRVLIQKTVLYSAVTAVLTLLYLLMAGQLAHLFQGWAGSGNFWSSALAAGGLAFLVNPVQNRIREFLEHRFFGNWLQDMSRGVAHEVKRPLNNIAMPAGMALMTLEEIKKGKISWMDAMPSLRQNLQLIMDQTLDAGRRIDAIQRVADDQSLFQEVDLHVVFNACRERLLGLAKRYKIPIIDEIPASLKSVSGDAQQLEIALGNLIKNALEACGNASLPEGSCKLWLRAREKDDRVIVTVKDSGPGMSPDVKSRLFEPYQTTKGAHGMGIGLYLTQKIILNHHGSLKVLSELGKGTEFVIDLPKFKPPSQ